MKNILAVVKNYNCTGCGSCESICPTQCITIKFDSKKGVNLPIVNTEECIECERCLKVCPGENVNIPALTRNNIDGELFDIKLGQYQALSLGNAKEQEIRLKGASGGTLTALLSYLFNSNAIDGALVLQKNNTHPFNPKPVIIRSQEELANTQGSWYCPVSPNTALKEIIDIPGKYAVIGLPCQIHSVRKMQELNPELKNRILLCLGLFCQNNCTLYGTKFFFKIHKAEFSKINSINYRSGKWPGKIEIIENDTAKHFLRVEKNPFKQKIFDNAFHHSFTQPRCLVCKDFTNELADITFGDPHLKELVQTEDIGKNIIIIRTQKALQLMNLAIENSYIDASDLDLATAHKAQNFKHKETVSQRMIIWKLLGRNIPDYGTDNKLIFNLKKIIRALKYFWSYSYSGGLLLKTTGLFNAGIYIKAHTLSFIGKIMKKV